MESEALSPAVVLDIYGAVIGKPTGRSASESRVDPRLKPDEVALLEPLIRELWETFLAREIELANEDRADIRAQLETLSSQLKSPHPSRRIALGAAAVLSSLLLSVAANAIWAIHGEQLLDLLSSLT